MITNDNDFLCAIIKCSDENNNCSIDKLLETTKMSGIDCLGFINSLNEKGAIKSIDFQTIHINPLAFSLYQSPKKKMIKSGLKLSVSFLKYIVTYILGIISGIIVSYINYHFGW